MKTIVLMGISCLLLAGVYGVMNRQSEVSKILSFTQAHNAASPFTSDDQDKTTTAFAADSNSITNTLDDSHWSYDPLFEKAAGSEQVTESETPDMAPPSNAAQETIKQATPRQGIEEPAVEPIPQIKQLILELNPDTTTNRKVPVDVV